MIPIHRLQPTTARVGPLLLALWLAGGVGLACGEAPQTAERTIVTTVPPLQWVAQQLAGPDVRVHSLLPPAASPATHAPTLEDRRALSQAALLVRVGHPAFPFERAWLERLLAERGDLRVVSATPEDAAFDDPHVWTDPMLVRGLVDRLQTALSEIWPAEQAAIAARADALRSEIGALDAEIRDRLAPVKGRPFFVFHSAWGHFARAYGLEQVALEHDHKEPGPRELARVLERARAARARVVFRQPQFDPASAEVLASEIGARVEPLDPLAYDWPANLRHVAQRLAEALAP